MSEAETPDERSPDERRSVLTVATLTKVHGIRGELKLRCEPEILALLREVAEEAETVTLRMPETGDEFEVTFASVRGHESAPIVAIDGVEDREGAVEFRGWGVPDILSSGHHAEIHTWRLEQSRARTVRNAER